MEIRHELFHITKKELGTGNFPTPEQVGLESKLLLRGDELTAEEIARYVLSTLKQTILLRTLFSPAFDCHVLVFPCQRELSQRVGELLCFFLREFGWDDRIGWGTSEENGVSKAELTLRFK